MNLPAFTQEPEPTLVNDSGYSSTSLPYLPYFEYDGGSSTGVSGPAIDGGNSSYVPIPAEGCA